jgi:hypothetical protein
MLSQNLYFNILTFDFPQEKQALYFSKQETPFSQRIHRSLFPNEIERIFPGVTTDGTEFIYSTFDFPKNGFTPLNIDFRTDNQYLVCRFYNRKINYYFKKVSNQLVRSGFIGQNQVWIYSNELSDEKYSVYYKFSLKIQLANVSPYPELVLSYDGKSKVFKKSTAIMVKSISQSLFKWVIKENQLFRFEDLVDHDEPGFNIAYPVLNIPMARQLNIEPDAKTKGSKYKSYRALIKRFYKNYLNNEDFLEIIPLHASGFLKVPEQLIENISDESNDLKFEHKNPGKFPKRDFFLKKPFLRVNDNIHLFFIYHKDDEATRNKLQYYLENGLDHYKGLTDYAGILFHTSDTMNICFVDRDNPIPEVREYFESKFKRVENVKYLAIYLTPFSKEETRKQQVRIYARIKQLLIEREIACQFVEPSTVEQPNNNFKWSLTTMSVTILAKLGGIPWRLNTVEKEELIIGIGAFHHPDGVRYVSSAIVFDNTGHFNEFDYFIQHQTDILAGSIAAGVTAFAKKYGHPKRLIIHFYKKLSEDELQPIERALNDLQLPNPIPIFIVSINKTEAKDITAFDRTKSNPDLMPYSGTYISIGKNKYLLFNNSRYPSNFNSMDGFPFPLKLLIDCNDKKQLVPQTIYELIDQVYQFSRMYWKSLAQQNLPVTVSYPEMITEVAPYFEQGIIPDKGKDNLWFL